MKNLSLKALCVSLLFSLAAYGMGVPGHDAMLESIKKNGIDESFAHKPQAPLYKAKPRGVATNSSKKGNKNAGFYPERLAILDAAVDNFVSSGQAPLAFTVAYGQGDCHKHFAGVENIETQKPFTGDTIIRLYSQSKFTGTVGLLKLIDKGVITGFEPLADFIPEFANTKVLIPGNAGATITLTDAVSANGTTTLTFSDTTVRAVGDWVTIANTSDVLGIPASQINGTRRITAVSAGASFSIVVATAASGSGSALGGTIQVQSMTAPLERPITLYHVMTHTLGYSYGTFGFGEDAALRNVQNGIYTQLQIPAANPNPAYPLSFGGVQEWSKALAQVPVLFQPGVNWSYGPTLSILGAVIEVIDARQGNNRDLETYLQEELFKPLGMNSTGFFIQNNAPDRAEKLARTQTLYFVAAPHVFIPFAGIPGSEYREDYFYGLNQPKTLALIDGGMYGTPNDYLKFMRMFLNNGFTPSGESILSPAMITWLSENHTLENSIINIYDATGPQQPSGAKFLKWGLGVAIATGSTRGLANGLVGGTTRAINWSGAAGTQYQIDFGNDTVVTAGTNLFAASLGTPAIVAGTLVSLNFSALKDVNPNNENASGNNPESAANPT